MSPIQTLLLFAHTARCASFGAAGEAFGLSGSAISKAMAQLETELGTALFVRSPRGIALAEEGQRYLRHVAHIIELHEDAAQELVTRQVEPSGELRVLLHQGIAHAGVAARVAEYLHRYPKVRVTLITNQGEGQLGDAASDLALTYTPPSTRRVQAGSAAQWVVRPVVSLVRYTVASPRYLRINGVPKDPAALRAHRCLVRIGQESWHFEQGATQQSIEIEAAFASNDGNSLVQAAVNDCGIAHLLSSNLAGRLRDGSLQRVLGDWNSKGPTVYAVYASGARRSAKLVSFIRFVEQVYSQQSNP